MTCWFPGLAEEILTGQYADIRPSLMLFIEGAGYLTDWDVILMQAAYCLEPEKLNPTILIKSSPYTRPGFFSERLMAAESRGWLFHENEKYGLTDPGHEIIEGIYELCDRLYAKINTLPDSKMEQLVELSDRLIFSIQELDEPKDKPAFELSMIFVGCQERSLVVQLRQRMFALLAFRDDAHMTSWQSYEQDGQIWESFSLIGRGEIGNAAQLADQLSHRDYTEVDYAIALEKIKARGWIALKNGLFVVQPGAAKMKEDVVANTNHLYCHAFARLSSTDKQTFQNLMVNLASTIALDPVLKSGVR
jgi:hypothetical protein